MDTRRTSGSCASVLGCRRSWRAPLGRPLCNGVTRWCLVWRDIDGDDVLLNSAEGRKTPQHLRRNPRIIDSLQAGNDAQAPAVFHGKARLREMGADDHIDKLAKRFLNAEKYPCCQPGEKRVMVRISVDRIGGFGRKMQPLSQRFRVSVCRAWQGSAARGTGS